MKYNDFLQSKRYDHKASGFEVSITDLNKKLFDWQKVLVRWSLYKGKSAIFADCGLGKTPIQLEWAKHVYEKTKKNILILAPLAVSSQTKREGDKFGISVNVCKTNEDIEPGINITNYERLHYFNPDSFIGIVLDESSIIKNFSGTIRNQIIEAFLNTPYKLACTATPSPNDYVELGNHAEFLGVMTRAEMLSMFFINDAGDTGTWRLKGHVKNNIFWEWLSSWSVVMRKPSDIGFENGKFILPELKINEHIIPYTGKIDTLFVEPANTLQERREARKESLIDRVALTSSLINQNGSKWIAWCNLNEESVALKKMINNSVEVRGSDDPSYKEKALIDFANGKIKCLVTKPRIAGFGMNFQICHNMAFVGLSDSYEQYYQAVRRCWRFGQEAVVNAHIITGEREGSVVANVKRKEKDMIKMFENMIQYMQKNMKEELTHFKQTKTDYNPTIEMRIPSWL